jgi:hypothetical protein
MKAGTRKERTNSNRTREEQQRTGPTRARKKKKQWYSTSGRFEAAQPGKKDARLFG